MAIAYVNSGQNSGFQNTNLPAASITGTSAGNQIVALILWRDSTASITLNSVAVTSGGSENLTLIGSPVHNANGDLYGYAQIAYLSNIVTGGNYTVTATLSDVAYSYIQAIEFSGGDTAGFYDSAENGATASGTDDPTCTVTTNTANALIVAIAAGEGGDPTQDTGYTLLTQNNHYQYNNGQYDVDVGAAGSKTVTMAIGGSGQSLIKAAAFKPASSAISITPTVGTLRTVGQTPSISVSGGIAALAHYYRQLRQ